MSRSYFCGKLSGGLVIIKRKITHEEIVRFIRDKEELQNYINEQKGFLSREYQELAAFADSLTEEEAAGLSLSRTPVTAVRETSPGYGSDLQQILNRAAKERKERLVAWKQDYTYLIDLEAEMERVWACLKTASPKSFLILNRLYVKKEKWDNVVYDMNISKTTLSRLRENGLEEIRLLYESAIPIKDMKIARLRN